MSQTSFIPIYAIANFSCGNTTKQILWVLLNKSDSFLDCTPPERKYDKPMEKGSPDSAPTFDEKMKRAPLCNLNENNIVMSSASFISGNLLCRSATFDGAPACIVDGFAYETEFWRTCRDPRHLHPQTHFVWYVE